MQTIVYAVYAKLNSILDFTDNINQIELLTQKRWLKLNPHHTFELRRLKECCIPAAWTTFAAVVGKYP